MPDVEKFMGTLRESIRRCDVNTPSYMLDALDQISGKSLTDPNYVNTGGMDRDLGRVRRQARVYAERCHPCKLCPDADCVFCGGSGSRNL